MKRLIVCSDGTWNTPDQRSGGEFRPTNVVKMARAIAPSDPDGVAQVVFYDQGVGTGNLLDRVSGGAFGRGLDKNIEDGYRFLMHNYEPGDDIFLFGFSRGAYTVRSLAGLIYNAGLLRTANAHLYPDAYRLYRDRIDRPDSTRAVEFKEMLSYDVDITFLGVWDTVGAMGIPVRGLRRLSRGRYEFHGRGLSPRVKRAFHALAIDERRSPFRPSIWKGKSDDDQVVEQVWFPGVHSDIGGGYLETGLSDVAFHWMVTKAKGSSLAFEDSYIDDLLEPDPLDALHDSKTSFYKLTPDLVRYMGVKSPTTEAVHPSALARHETSELNYNPENLLTYKGSEHYRVAGE